MILHTNISPRRKTDSPLQLQAYSTEKIGQRRGKEYFICLPLPVPVFHSDISGLASLLPSFQKGIPYLATKVKPVSL